jgi:hypothetical protein
MKKILVAAAAFLLTGSLLSQGSIARADVNLGGDARLRYIYKDNYDFGNSEQDAADYIDSRIRITFAGKAKGGAFIKVRMRLDDIKWDGQDWDAYQEPKNVWADYAWMGIPMGPVTVEAGRMVADYTEFFSWDNRPTRLQAVYKNGSLTLTGLLDVMQENVNAVDDWYANDFMAAGLLGSYKFSDTWLLKAYARYEWDDREWQDGVDEEGNDILIPRTGDNSGFLGSIHLDGRLGGFNITTEIAYEEAGVLFYGKQNDGTGWYGNVSYDMGSFTPSLNVGITRDGYLADNDFGWIMLGNKQNNPTAVIDQLGTDGDWTWVAPSLSWAVNERFNLSANLVWVNVDGDAEADVTDKRLAKLYEVSGAACYTISEGADFTVMLGYLQPDFDGRIDGLGIQDDASFGSFGQLEIKF